MKHLYDISWKVSEPEYRKDPALSYSTIARFEREGFSKLPTLFDPVQSPSLTFGSVVDELITGDEQSFNNRFIIAEFPELKPSAEQVVKAAHETYPKYVKLTDIPDNLMLSVLDENKYFGHWKPETRLKDIRKPECCEYFRLLCCSGDKDVISQKVYDDAFATVIALRESPATRAYFSDNNTPDVQRYYQLKFKGSFNGVDYRCMADLILVDYKRKVIIPCDLKTSGHPEYEFPYSFLKWRYDLQARLYWHIIRQSLDKDPYFKEFTLADYRFIVVNRETRNPLVWKFGGTAATVPLDLGGKHLRTPWEIGKELKHYLDTNPKVPSGIYQTGLNEITEFFNGTYKNQTETD